MGGHIKVCRMPQFKGCRRGGGVGALCFWERLTASRSFLRLTPTPNLFGVGTQRASDALALSGPRGASSEMAARLGLDRVYDQSSLLFVACAASAGGRTRANTRPCVGGTEIGRKTTMPPAGAFTTATVSRRVRQFAIRIGKDPASDESQTVRINRGGRVIRIVCLSIGHGHPGDSP